MELRRFGALDPKIQLSYQRKFMRVYLPLRKLKCSRGVGEECKEIWCLEQKSNFYVFRPPSRRQEKSAYGDFCIEKSRNFSIFVYFQLECHKM